jgi:hypothetical protein
MKRRVSLIVGRKLRWLAPLVALVLVAGVAQSADRLAIPDEHPGPPVYARILGWVGYTEWAAVVFYRSPLDVPDDFNLGVLDVRFDPRLLNEGAPEILMEGFGIWEDFTGPGGTPPFQEVLRDVRGTPVPIWFVNWYELYYDFFLKDRDDDGEPDYKVLIGDFAEMESLRMGLADSYLEELQASGGAKVPMINIVASGVVVEGDGGGFAFQYVCANSPWWLTQTTLRFEEE